MARPKQEKQTEIKNARPYAERKAARIERLQNRASSLRAEGEARLSQARQRADRIPFGQPILVGHYSEGRDRRYREKIHNGFRKGYEAVNAAADLERRADAAEESTAISSDDPEAIAKLRSKLSEIEASCAVVKADVSRARKVTRGAPRDQWEAGMRAAGVSERFIRSVMVCGFVPEISGNASANVRRVKARIAELERRASAPAVAPVIVGECRIEESDNRVKVFFPGKPSADIRSRLKGAGFRWASSEGAWVSYISHHARESAKAIAMLGSGS